MSLLCAVFVHVSYRHLSFFMLKNVSTDYILLTTNEFFCSPLAPYRVMGEKIWFFGLGLWGPLTWAEPVYRYM